MDRGGLPAGITIRSIGADDVVRLERFYGDLSPDSIDARFHGAMHGIPDRSARSFCGPDHLHREGLVAITHGADGDEVIVGHLCLEPIGPDDVEMAVAVADAWQHHGIGHALLSAAIGWAETNGFARVRGAIRWSNPAILGLVRACGHPVAVLTDGGGDTEAVIDIRGELPAAA